MHARFGKQTERAALPSSLRHLRYVVVRPPMLGLHAVSAEQEIVQSREPMNNAHTAPGASVEHSAT